jgi:drug/metabolite transporter (DMT)-like permease
MKYGLIALIVVFAAACAQMLLKQGARQGYTPWYRQYLNGWVIGGYTLMFATMVANIWCMHRGLQLKELSIIESMSYFFVPALSWYLFNEAVTKRKMIAIGVIIVGVVIFFL